MFRKQEILRKCASLSLGPVMPNYMPSTSCGWATPVTAVSGVVRQQSGRPAAIPCPLGQWTPHAIRL
jgi:hypothetical protein